MSTAGSPSNHTATTPTPPIIPPAASPKLTTNPNPAPPSASAGSPPLSRPHLPGINQLSPRLSANQPSVSPAPSSSQHQPQGRETESPFGGGGGGARRNPMSVSSMLSGPPRASGVAAFTPSSAGPPQPPVLPPMSSSDSVPKNGRHGSPHEPPRPVISQQGSAGGGGGGQARSPILSRPTASGSNLPSFRPPSTHDVKPTVKTSSPSLEKKEPPTTSAAAQQPSKPAYPSLPSAFARESPYSTAPPSASNPSSSNNVPHQQSQHSAHIHPQASKAPAQPFFPNLAGYRPPPFPTNPLNPNASSSSSANHRQPSYGSPATSTGGSSAPPTSQSHPSSQHHTHPAAFPWQQQQQQQQQQGGGGARDVYGHQPSPKVDPHHHPSSNPSSSHAHSHAHSHQHSHSHPPPSSTHQHSHSHPTHSHSTHQHSHAPQHPHSHSHSHSHSHAHPSSHSTSAHVRRPSANGSIAHSPQTNRTPGGGMVKPSPAANIKGSSAAAVGGAGAGARFSSLMDGPYGQSIRENGPGMINKPSSISTGSPAVPNGHSQQHQSQPPPQKRRRSDTTSTSGVPITNLPPAPAQVTKLARASPSLPSTPAPVPPPPFTHTDLRLATVRPPLVSIDNSAIESYLATASTGFEKSGQPRPFAGRQLYDPFVSPAQLLDGATLRTCVGGTLELVVPTSLVVTPPSTPSSSSTIPLIRSSCSVPPISPPPISLSFGPPSSYDGSPLPLTSNTTPISLPPHLYDLPSFKTRQVWGTDVYTDDSDLLGILVHSGWIRLARRERKLRAGEKGAGDEAIRRARESIKEPMNKRKRVSTILNEVAQHHEEGEEEEVPKNLLVTVGIVPALVRYQGMERSGIRSRNWGNGHDGVSLRVENVQPLSVSFVASLE